MKKMRKTIAAMGIASLLLGLMALPVYALSDGVYTAPVSTYYLNPDTGVTDDGGSQNEALGEGMCRSAVHTTGLIEVENGKTYVTIRMLLASNVKDVQFTVQQTPGSAGSYQSVSKEILAENSAKDSVDYRFEVPSAGSYIGCSMYVTPMGRDVKFYIQVQSGGASSGNGDFVVSVSEAAEPEPVAEEAAGAAAEAADPVVAERAQDTGPAGEAEEAASGTAAPEDPDGAREAPSEEPEGEPDSDAKNPDDDGEDGDTRPDEEADDEAAAAASENESNAQVMNTRDEQGNRSGSGAFLIAAVIVAIVLAGGGGFLLYRKRKTGT